MTTRIPTEPVDPLSARLLVGLYPPSWRARYREEMLAVLTESGLDTRTATSLLAAAAGAWVRPARHLHDAPARMRATLTVVLAAWVALAAGALIFSQLYEDEGLRLVTPGHRATGILYTVFAAAAHVSVATLVIGATPLALQLARRSAGQHQYRDLLLLSLPATASIGYLAILVAVSRAVRHQPNGVGPGWFVVLTVLGLLTGGAIVAGPSSVLRRAAPTGGPVRLAVLAAGGAAAVMAIAALTSIANLIAIYTWTGPTADLHAPVGAILGYTAYMVPAAAIAITSSTRGLSAARPRPYRDDHTG